MRRLLRTMRRNSVFIKAIFLFLVGLIFVLSYYGSRPFSVLGSAGENMGKFFTSRENFSRFLISLGAYSPIFFILLQALQVVISPLPGELTGIVGGYIYGVILGFIYSTLGLTLGSWAAFELARILGRPFVEKFAGATVVKKFEFLTSNIGAAVCFALFIIPGFPKDVLCYLLGLSRMRLAMFLVLSTLGRMPGTFLLTLQGASVRNQHYYIAVASAFVCVALVFIAYIYRERLDHWLKNLSAKALEQKS